MWGNPIGRFEVVAPHPRAAVCGSGKIHKPLGPWCCVATEKGTRYGAGDRGQEQGGKQLWKRAPFWVPFADSLLFSKYECKFKRLMSCGKTALGNSGKYCCLSTSSCSIFHMPTFLWSNATAGRACWHSLQGAQSPTSSFCLQDGGKDFLLSDVRRELGSRWRRREWASLKAANKIILHPYLGRPHSTRGWPTCCVCVPAGAFLSLSNVPPAAFLSFLWPRHSYSVNLVGGAPSSTGRNCRLSPNQLCTAETAAVHHFLVCHSWRKPNCPKGHRQIRKKQKVKEASRGISWKGWRRRYAVTAILPALCA